MASLLHCMALVEIADMDDENFEIFDMEDIHPHKLQFLVKTEHDKCGVVMHWTQKLINEGILSGTVTAPPPIVSRCFQELSNGLNHYKEALKIKEIRFPFPYLQIVQLMLVVTSICAPIVNTLILGNFIASFGITLMVMSSFWSLNFIAAEIEMPYGDDPNDLPVREMQTSFNDYLRMLSQPEMITAPEVVNPTIYKEHNNWNLSLSHFSEMDVVSKRLSLSYPAPDPKAYKGHVPPDEPTVPQDDLPTAHIIAHEVEITFQPQLAPVEESKLTPMDMQSTPLDMQSPTLDMRSENGMAARSVSSRLRTCTPSISRLGCKEDATSNAPSSPREDTLAIAATALRSSSEFATIGQELVMLSRRMEIHLSRMARELEARALGQNHPAE